MSDPRKKYDSTVARIAGNILSGQGAFNISNMTDDELQMIAEQAVRMARAIVAATENIKENAEASQAGDQ